MSAERPLSQRLAILGVGLIGGSIGLAAREKLGVEVVVGADRHDSVLDAALAQGAITETASSVEEAVAGADIVVVAAPVGAISELSLQALAAAGEETVVTDVGSTKRQIVDGVTDRRFIGGHPIAGAETSGVEHARAELFDGATWYVTPTDQTAGIGLERLMRFVSGLGAQPRAIDAAAHDRMMADVSHLPHVLANVLVSQVAAALEQEGERLPVLGPSFRDATRVAGANGAIWNDIYLTNSDALVPELDSVIARLMAVREAMAEQSEAEIDDWNNQSAEDRRKLLEAELAGGPVCELRASVPNQPGIIAQITLELGKAGVNIVDMALYPAADLQSGAITLWVAGDEAATRAEQLISELGFPVART